MYAHDEDGLFLLKFARKDPLSFKKCKFNFCSTMPNLANKPFLIWWKTIHQRSQNVFLSKVPYYRLVYKIDPFETLIECS